VKEFSVLDKVLGRGRPFVTVLTGKGREEVLARGMSDVTEDFGEALLFLDDEDEPNMMTVN